MRLKKSGIVLLIIIFSSIIFGSIKLYERHEYKKTYEYKFLEINYELDEIKILEENLTNEQLDILLEKEKDPLIVTFIQEKYFMFKNLDKYITYFNDNKKTSYSDVVVLVNVNRDKDFYEDIKKTNTNDGVLMLVNKYYFLEKTYIPKDIVEASASYAYANNSLNKEAYEAFISLHNEGLKNGHTILINSSFREYNHQERLWKQREELFGKDEADEYAARAGHSEHQTGYTIDVADYNDRINLFENTESFKWLIKNAHKYGFILRYPENKENITGYLYEPWHYRYVGKDTAEKIYKEKITFDEYHAYYVNIK